MERTAYISECGTYRYVLTRTWDPGLPKCTFVMLNPSTADGTQDDPTIRKCIGFAQRWGLGGLAVVNLFAYRATKPKALADAYEAGIDIVGPRNQEFVERCLRNSEMTIVAWGGSGGAKVQKLISQQAKECFSTSRVLCLGTTKTGQPCHPVMLAYATQKELWTP